MALEFARLDWKVTGCARTVEGISTLAEELGDPHIFQVVDVTDDTAMHTFAKTVIDDLGVPNLLVNNAALMNANTPLKDISPEEFAKILAVNLGGVHNSIRAFLPFMEDAERGANATLTVNLEDQEITGPDGGTIKFDLDPFKKHCLLNGLDDIGLTMQKGEKIDTYEGKQKAGQPWLYAS